jgi:hypothetical protein
MNHMIDDNRFVLIEKYKQKLIEGTNISDRPEEMAVIDSILFRLWQMGWLDKLEEEAKWIPCSERLPKDNRQVLVYARSVHYALAKYDEMRNADGTYKKQWVTFDAWKPLYTIKEVIAWMPLPEPCKGVTE